MEKAFVARALPWLGIIALGSASCGEIGDDGRDPIVRAKTFAPVDPLTVQQVTDVVKAAAEASDTGDVAIAVLDRIGNVLRLYLRGVSVTTGVANPDLCLDLTDADRRRLNAATAIARGAAFLSHSQAPLTTRTGQFLSSFHFPPVFDHDDYLTVPPFVFPGVTIPVQRTIGVANTAQAPLWQIDASNRGTPFESTGTMPATSYASGASIPVAGNPDVTTTPCNEPPSPGLGPVPGGIPLYDAPEMGFDVPRRLIGAIGVYVTDTAGLPVPDLAEFMADVGSGAFNFGAPDRGAVSLVGVLLPNVAPDANGTGAGNYDPVDEIAPFATADARPGQPDPGERFLIEPQDSLVTDGLTEDEVQKIINQCVLVSRETHAAIRIPVDSACQMTISVCDRDGVLLGVYRELDGTLFSLEISITKARNAVFFSDPASRWTGAEAGVLAGRHPLTGFRPRRDPVTGEFLPAVDALGNLISANGDIVDVFPKDVLEGTGVAVTARTLGFLTQPFYPPGIDGAPQAGPLYYLVEKNRVPGSFTGQGFAARFGDPGGPPYRDTFSGIIFFPGSAPLYRDGVLVGGIGVSGDGVEQDDLVTVRGIRRAQGILGFTLEPPVEIRADNYSFEGAGIPYFKFPQNPGG